MVDIQPTKELVESVISEVVEQRKAHKEEGKECHTEFCEFMTGMGKFGEHPLDEFSKRMISGLSCVPILMLSNEVVDVFMIARFMFYVGVKTGRLQTMEMPK